MKKIYVLLLLSLPFICPAQYVFNAAYQNVKFGGPGVTIVNKVGNGNAAGNVVLYQNVINIGGQQIDAIIRTKSLSAGAMMMLDQQGTGTGYTNNNPTWFSPQFLFPAGGGSAVFNFEFILGNSYDNATNTGTSVTLENIMVNSYDIDGNDSVNSKQFTEFGGFFTTELSNTTTLTTSYNAATNLTRFASTIDANVVNAAHPNTRVRVAYEELNNFEISVGAGAAGVAYFFIDFDMGAEFGVPTTITTAPTLDLNTGTSGSDNNANHCSSAVAFTAGASNISSLSSTPSGGTTIERLKIYFPTSQISNGSSERLLINGATSGGTIALNFANAAAISNIVLTGTTYTVTAAITAGESSLSFMKSGSTTMSIAEGEKLLDAFRYHNTSASPTGSSRSFEVRVKDGALESMPAYFNIALGTFANITRQASDTAVPSGSNAVFSIASNATTYQWQVNTGNGVFTNIVNSSIYSGATTNTLNLTNVNSLMNNYIYRVITGSACQVNSSSASLSVLTILPVNWTDFSASNQEKNILLTWITSNEVNTKSFVVEHSVDGNVFTTIGSTNANNHAHSRHTYHYAHSQPSRGTNYYRIKQIDNDRRISYSKVISIYKTTNEQSVVMANPVVNGQLALYTTITGQATLFDAQGRIVKKQSIASGNNHIDVSELKTGIYTFATGSVVRKVIIAN